MENVRFVQGIIFNKRWGHPGKFWEICLKDWVQLVKGLEGSAHGRQHMWMPTFKNSTRDFSWGLFYLFTIFLQQHCLQVGNLHLKFLHIPKWRLPSDVGMLGFQGMKWNDKNQPISFEKIRFVNHTFIKVHDNIYTQFKD